jgi:hypothetical protein
VLLPECLSSRPVGVELELLMPVLVPATMPLKWDFIERWFASFGSADRRLTEQRRNRRLCLFTRPMITCWISEVRMSLPQLDQTVTLC